MRHNPWLKRTLEQGKREAEQNERIEAPTQEIYGVRAENADLKARLEALERRVGREFATEAQAVAHGLQAIGPTATTKYAAGTFPTFRIPCSSPPAAKAAEPGPNRYFLP